MRITHLRFANLNALVGEWSIDFNDPAFLDDGIFAITGPTGAGKTTILDAICLALYGSTPRLGRITTGQNEIMSRRQGDCFAEVKFDTAKGSYCCHWGQHRSRHQADGSLQQAKHEIADATTGKVIATRLKDVEKQVQELTGMDFEQFTRSMLLAQGSFSAFLQASPSERSPILEKITGTGIYTEISKVVYLRQKEHKQALEELKKELAYIEVMTPEQKQHSEAEFTELVLRCQDQEQQQTQRESRIQHYRKTLELQAQSEDLAHQQQALTQAQQAFACDAERLHAHQRTEPLREAFQRLQDLQTRHHHTQLQWTALQERLPELEQAYTVAQQTSQACKTTLTTLETQWEQDNQTWEQMRILDNACVHQTTALHQQHQRLTQEQGVYEELTQALAQKTAQQSRLHAQSQSLQIVLDQTAHHQQLIEEMARFRELVKHLTQDQTTYQRVSTHLQGAQQQQLQQQRVQAEQAQQQIADAETKAQSQQHLAACLAQLNAYPAVSTLNTQWAQVSARLSAVEQSRQTVMQWQAAEQDLRRCQTQLKEGHEQAAQAELERLQKQTTLDHMTQEIQHLQRQWDLEQHIEKLEDYRKKLVAGDPCPLCGATEHPLGHAPSPLQPEHTQAKLAQLQQTAQRLQSELHQLMAQTTAWKQQADRLHTECLDLASKISTFQQDLNHADLSSAPDTHSTAEVWFIYLEQSLQTLNTERHAVTTQLKAREQVERDYQQALTDHQQRLERLENQAESYRKQAQERDRLNQDVLYDTDQLAQLVQRMDKHLATLKHQWHLCMGAEHAFPELSHLQNQALTAQDITQLAHMLTTLDDHKNRWQQRHQEHLQSQQALQLSQQEQESLGQQLEKATARHTEVQASYQTLVRETQQLQAERRQRFGERSASSEETQSREALRLARTAMQAAERVDQEARESLLKAQQQAETAQKTYAQEQTQFQSLQETFGHQLAQADFATVQDFQSAVLSGETRHALLAQAQQLASEKTRLETRQQTLQQQFTQLQAAANVSIQNDAERLEVEADYAKARFSLQEMLKQQGVLQAQLAHDKHAHQQQAQQLKLLQQLQETYAHWKVMYDLIGSSDGKRYRDFAQGLTFDVVLSHANAQLQKMSGRYLLVRASAYDLDLSVMDQQQGGEVRSAQNLSGGESFIVSMALALGLSQMASKNVQVDSLFLDEGFGTLDEEALEVALNTLAELHQENKLIGVISHVPSLKERISTQIKVKPLPGGVSRLEGPGCKRLEHGS